MHQNLISPGVNWLQEFYKDWWNASNVGEYWRLWNIPVHKWMLRTVYYPALNLGIGRNMAMLLVFFVSAVFHEIAVAVPLKLTRIFPWSFMGILGQVNHGFAQQVLIVAPQISNSVCKTQQEILWCKARNK